MLNRVNRRQELARVNMLIRALSDEMADETAHQNTRNTIPLEMKEALYELRVRKLLISAVAGSERVAVRHVRH